ncbi:hypothetical protein GGI43DRAFT_383858 [Trichoderma evansii]
MPTLRERKNPSAGTKADMGKDAPVNRESAGLVEAGSLAAESYEHGGEFAENRNVHVEGVSSSGKKSEASGRQDRQEASGRQERKEAIGRKEASGGQETSGRQGKKSAVAGEAPSHVADQYIKDPKGPHGKNVKEGISDKPDAKNDGLQKALRSEPGSEDDPSRLAERQMLQGQSLGGGGAGPRQGHLTGETKYGALDNEVSSWLRQLLDRFHSIRIFAFRDGNRLEDASHHAKASMPAFPEEKSMLRPLQRPETDSRQQHGIRGLTSEDGPRDASKSSADGPPRGEIDAEEMEHQRYGEAQPQLVPSDVIETMMMAKGRKTESLSGV